MTHLRLQYRDEEIAIGAGPFVVGRGTQCQLVLEDSLISRRHAAFRVKHGALWVEDLQSRNGVHVNAARIAGPVKLAEGDVVTIGGQQFGVVRSEVDPPVNPRRAPTTMNNELLHLLSMAIHGKHCPEW